MDALLRWHAIAYILLSPDVHDVVSHVIDDENISNQMAADYYYCFAQMK